MCPQFNDATLSQAHGEFRWDTTTHYNTHEYSKVATMSRPAAHVSMARPTKRGIIVLVPTAGVSKARQKCGVTVLVPTAAVTQASS